MTNDNKLPKLFYDIYDRIDNNQNALIAITGGVGSGKTFAACRLGELLTQVRGVPFTADHFCLSVVELLRIVVKGNLPKGSVLVMDESGISMNNRDWQSVNNKLIQFLLQTFRHRNLIVIFCAPDLGFVDKSSRKLLHLWFETESIDRKLSICWTRPKWVFLQQQTGDFHYVYPTIQEEGTIIPTKMTRAGFHLASKTLRDAVDAKLDAYKTGKAQEWLEELEAKNAKKAAKEAKPQLTAQQQQIQYLNNEIKLDQQSIARVLSVDGSLISRQIASIANKGLPVLRSGLRKVSDEEIDTLKQAVQTGVLDTTPPV